MPPQASLSLSQLPYYRGAFGGARAGLFLQRKTTAVKAVVIVERKTRLELATNNFRPDFFLCRNKMYICVGIKSE